MKQILDKIGRFKFPLLILLLGILMMLIPSGAKKTGAESCCELGDALSLTEGVGEACVLISENGVVVVCDGARDAKVRIDITEAVKAYTGFGADKITILKRDGTK